VRSALHSSSVTIVRSWPRSISSARRSPIPRSCIPGDTPCKHPASRSLMRVETSFDLIGDLIGVDAVVVGPTGRAKVQLILDTGAVMTTVVPNVADSIGYSSALRVGWTVTRTAAAEERGYIVRSEV